MPIFPLGDVHIEGSDADRALIQETMKEMVVNGTGWWCGYSFSWYACLGARIREPNRAVWGLHNFLSHFTSPNTFHVNGDDKQSGASWYNYRPFTLEGNFGAAHAVNEMLLQSWGDNIRLFPAVPDHWLDVSFTDLRAEGAFAVSAWRKGGAFVRAKIVSEKGTRLRLAHPHPTRNVVVRSTGSRKQTIGVPGRDIELPSLPGECFAIELQP
jgi:alpha-L-fucosidase 2